ncbi:MAG: DUF427 domain-containing protein [Acidimicrobiales bacterium]
MPRGVWNGAEIAESDAVEVVDGYSYFPADAVDHDRLRPSDHHSVCPWKGTASYYVVVVDGEVNAAAALYYPGRSPRAKPLVGGRIGFWRGVKIERDADADAEHRGLLSRLAGRRR